ncbi:hypothetical protein ACLPHM_15365 [Paenalcaligenes sp. Me131]|uniref:hypothetical protein n=1 Tax=Paenalcaligenes sp. Me131 TaxID=3392636 RepID=UPI003D2AB9B3
MFTSTQFSRPAIWGRYLGRLFCVVALSIGLAACGGSNDSDDDSPTTPEKPDPSTPPAAVIHCAP